MRYYKIVINDPDGNLVQTSSSVAGSDATYTSFVNNRSLPGALNVELDVPLAPYHQPLGSAFVRVWGISLNEIAQATQLNPIQKNGEWQYHSIAVYGGMQKGLPLANPKQAGLLVEGVIFQAFGNWVGTSQSLDLIIAPEIGTVDTPKNIVLTWKGGTPLKDAIQSTLATAFPDYTAIVNIDARLVLNYDQDGYYQTLGQFATYVNQISVAIIDGDNYPGVDVFVNEKTIFVSDGTTPTTPKVVAFQDLIGQPTWMGGLDMNFRCVMRADIIVGDYIKMPPALVTTSAAAASSLVNLKAAFAGTFRVNEARHVGCFRQPDADSWTSSFVAYPVPN